MTEGISRLRQWMEENGYRDLGNTQPHDFKDTGRGLKAVCPLAKDAVILEVPSELIITSDTVMESALGDIIQKHHITPLQAICLFLMCEQQIHSASFWSEYILSLPESYSVPTTWSPELVSRLPAVIAGDVINQRNSVRALYDECGAVIEEVERVSPALRGCLSYDRFVWAWSTVNTRCVYWKRTSHSALRVDGEDHYALVPYLDLLNHSDQAQTDAGYDPVSKCYRVKTLTPYSVDDQVFISYGPHSNKKLLMEYGFVLPDNCVDFIPGEIGDVCSATKSAGIEDSDWLDIVSKNDLHLGLGYSDEGLTWSFLTTLKIAALASSERNRWTECLEDGYLSDQHQDQTNKLVQVVLDAERKKYDFCVSETPSNEENLVIMFCNNYLKILDNIYGTL